MLECPHRCMHDQFCIKFPNRHRCMCVMEIMWGIPFIPEPLSKPWHISWPAILQALKPKSQLIINLDPGWECQSLPSEENKKKKEKEKAPDQRIGRKQKEKILNQRVGESKKRKFLIKDREKTEEICRKVVGPDNIWTIQNCHQVNEKGKETTT